MNIKKIIHVETIESKILLIRGQKVILDADLAKIYGVPTKRLNEQVKRNREKFPEDFIFQLSREEKAQVVAICDHLRKLKFSSGLPYAFTEYGAVMAANVLNSPQAVRMSVFVVRAFVRMRQVMSDNRELAKKLAQLEKMLTARLDIHEKAIFETLEQLTRLLNPEAGLPDRDITEPPRRIGFTAREKRAKYAVVK